jgi:hypothetical protein
MATLNVNPNLSAAGIVNELKPGISRNPEKPSAAYQYFQSAPHHYHHHAHHQHHNGFCHNCCHPIHSCCCNHKECQKVCKELLVQADTGKTNPEKLKEIEALQQRIAAMKEKKQDTSELEAQLSKLLQSSTDRASESTIIGGGCCVHLSVEFMSMTDPSTASFSISVLDSENTLISWGKNSLDEGYHIKEDIITTNPGAILKVTAENAIVRVRWCEVFSG